MASKLATSSSSSSAAVGERAARTTVEPTCSHRRHERHERGGQRHSRGQHGGNIYLSISMQFQRKPLATVHKNVVHNRCSPAALFTRVHGVVCTQPENWRSPSSMFTISNQAPCEVVPETIPNRKRSVAVQLVVT
eukprot:scaffold105036_cov85-Phaeocystis_antarctica.AAC.1